MPGVPSEGERGRGRVSPPRPLSARECATITALGRGYGILGVRRLLGARSVNTVKTFELRARRKLGASTRAEAVLLHERAHGSCARA